MRSAAVRAPPRGAARYRGVQVSADRIKTASLEGVVEA